MSTKESSTAEEETNLFANDTLPTIWVDGVRVASRADGICAISFDSQLPHGVFEQVRLMTTEKMIKGIVDQLCSSLDYYPDKDE